MDLRSQRRKLDRIYSSFTSFSQVCSSICTESDFSISVHPRLREFIPHGMFACGIGTSASQRIDYCINIGFPDEYISQILSSEICFDKVSLLKRWFVSREPMFFDSTRSEQFSKKFWAYTTHQHGINNLLCHGVMDIQGATTTYVCFADVMDYDETTLQLVSPFLHIAMRRLYEIRIEHLSVKPKTQLTTREQQILNLVGKGLTNNEIGEILMISPWTVKVHIRNLMHKLDAVSRAQAVARSFSLGS